jgi:hypothetical protein
MCYMSMCLIPYALVAYWLVIFVFTVYEYGLLVIIRLEPENRLLRSGNRIFGYQIPEQYFGSAFLKPEFLITRKNRPELSGKTECPALIRADRFEKTRSAMAMDSGFFVGVRILSILRV